MLKRRTCVEHWKIRVVIGFMETNGGLINLCFRKRRRRGKVVEVSRINNSAYGEFEGIPERHTSNNRMGPEGRHPYDGTPQLVSARPYVIQNEH